MSAKNTITDKRNIKQPVSKETNPPKEEALSHKPTFGEAAERPGVEQEEPEHDHTLGKQNEAPEPPNPAIQPGNATEDVTAPGARIMGEKHQENVDQVKSLADEGGAEVAETDPPVNEEAEAERQTTENQDQTVSTEVQENLDDLTDLQGSGPDPDGYQESIHQPTTEDQFRAPQTRPHTIDPETGQVHYAGDVESLPGGTAANEGKDA